jgi:predicted short-subunit dehydrogenase-like oxidoreductase (DUF2520 family)
MRELERERTDTTAPPPALPPIAVIGAGRVGGAIEAAGRAAGLEVTLGGRDELASSTAGAEVALLCVPDAGIAAACEGVLAANPELRFVGHTSGATGLGALQPATGAGAATFSLHPLQTIPDATATLAGAPAAIAGSDREALELARRLASALGLSPVEVPDDARPAYHAAAAIASNFLVALEESAVALLARAGIDEGRELLAPLVLRSAANWAEQGGEALTGPIARGDEPTVQAHREALAAAAPELIPLYEALADRTRALASGREEGR